jgi:hypothetical protein
MNADDTRFSIPAVWSVLYSELYGTPWRDEDVDAVMDGKNPDVLLAAVALKFVYSLEWKGVDTEDGVLATLKAARKHYGGMFLTPGQVKEMGCHFTARYADLAWPMNEYLEERCGQVRWNWLNDHGRSRIKSAVMGDSEIWVDDVNDGDDVWVFTKPGRT